LIGIHFLIDLRTSAKKVGLDKIAEKIRENNFHAVLIIGGYEVNKSISITARFF
jgi:hypothetical protein